MERRKITNNGHQGDVGIRRIYQLKAGGDYYVKTYDRKTRKFGDKLYCTKEEMAKRLSADRVIKPDAKGFVTLIEGESSGHHHGVMKTSNAVAYAQPDAPTAYKQRVFLMEVKDTTEFMHWHVKQDTYTKDHNSIELPCGIWEMRSQVEQDLDGRLKAVVD